MSENLRKGCQEKGLCQKTSAEFAKKGAEMAAKLKSSDELHNLGQACTELLKEPS